MLSAALKLRSNFGKAFAVAVAAVVACAAVAAPLNRSLPSGSFVGKVIGFGLMGAAMLVFIETPILYALRWTMGGRIVVPRFVWALLGGIVAMVPIVMMNVPGETLWVKATETIEASWSQPMIFASEWLPFVVGGGIFGFLFSSRRV